MANRVPITVRLDRFEGPLDLLLYLIQTHELDISKVSIGKITDQYLTYVRLMQELNFDAASEFLVMAATLLHWKSRALLPQDPTQAASGSDEEAALTQEDLVRQLLEHRRFLEAGETLGQLPLLGDEVFTRSNRKPPIERVWRSMNITDLSVTYQDILVRARKRTQILKKETVSLSDRIIQFGEQLPVGQWVNLRSLLSLSPNKSEIVVTFLAALELSRLKKMKLLQEGVYAEILMQLLESLKNFDPNLASGFDSITAAMEAQSVQNLQDPPAPATATPTEEVYA